MEISPTVGMSLRGWTRKRFQRAIVMHKANPLDMIMIAVIITSGITVGIETVPSIRDPFAGIFHALDMLFVLLFAFEAAIKISCYGRRPWRYFQSGWNLFDFGILLLTAVPVVVLSNQSAAEAALALRSMSIIRSLRVLRFLRIASELPGIRVIVETLVRSLPQLSVVGVMLFSLVYTYAVIGYNLFHGNDPKNFGNLGQSMLTMFQCLTGDFGEIMHIQIDGSNFDEGLYQSMLTHYHVVTPEKYPVLGPLFFLSFVFIGGFTILNFFVGTILSELDAVRDEERQQNTELTEMHRRFDRLEKMISPKSSGHET